MKCFIIAAISADGYIAKNAKHAAFWTSKEDKKRFVELTKRAGIVVMGHNTFATLPSMLRERTNIVYSFGIKPEEEEKFKGVEITKEKPSDLLQTLESRGFKEVAICGGSEIYTMFMKAGVVDTLYLTIEPVIFGSGVRLFNGDMLYQLHLKNSGQAENGSLLLEYRVDYAGAPTTIVNDSTAK